MAVFTVELRDIDEDQIYASLRWYPIFSEDYRYGLNRKIYDHYFYNEIGHETVSQFLKQLKTKMNEIMPYYNKLYESELIKFDPLITQKLVNEQWGENQSTHDSTSTANATNKADTTGSSETVSSQYPQVSLSGNEDYATNSSRSNSVNDSVNTAESVDKGKAEDSTNSHGKMVSEGYSGSPAALINEYRSILLNIDMMVIGELSELFMGLFNSSDSYTSNGGVFGYGYGYLF